MSLRMQAVPRSFAPSPALCAGLSLVFGRFYRSHRIKGLEVGVELRGVASSVASAILPTIAGPFVSDHIFTWRATEIPLGS